MKLSPRENLLSLYRRQGYEYAPAEIMLSPAQLRAFTQKTGRPENELAEHFAFPFRGVQGLREIAAGRAEFLRYYPYGLKPGAGVTGWGVAHEPGGSEASRHFTRMRHPLAGDVTMDGLAAYPFPRLAGGNEGAQREQAARIKARGLAAYGHMSCTVWETAWYMRGMEDLLVDMAEGDEKAAFLLDVVTDYSEKQAAAFARAGVDVIALGDDIGMQRAPMMSLALYREYLKPRLARVIRAAREVKPDLLIQYHSCGFVEPFLGDLVEVGVDILNPVQPECMPFADIYAKYGDRLSFNGALGTQTTRPFGAPEDVRRVVFENLDIAGDRGGLFVCPTHVVEPEVPWENIEAYFKACEEYKKNIRNGKAMRFFHAYDLLTDGLITLRLTGKYPGSGENLPYYYWDIFSPDGEPAGKISIRIGDNAHSYYNGHIGYEIDEAHRGRHYALRACKLVLPVARAHGMQRIYMTCGISNTASRKTIERLGAALAEVADIPESCCFWRPGMEKYCVYFLML
ncbi:MAG: GNAT family N-acetyltransferase [Oscillospiraceae bacterium]|nr:GNAT family N-acetyltransferase [Oscillospiraceae bacterium]